MGAQSTTEDHTRIVKEAVKQHLSTIVQEKQAKHLNLVFALFWEFT